MVKNISSALRNHLDEETTSLATCWRVIRKDGQEFYFTDHDRDILFEGNTYLAEASYLRTAVTSSASFSVDNVDLEGVLSSDQISITDLRAGLFDYAEVRIFLVNWASISDGALKMRRGWIGEVTLTEQGVFRAELRGLAQALDQKLGEMYQPECRADLGDSRCKVPVQPPERANDTDYSLGTFVKVPTAAGSGQETYENRIYECTTEGTSATSEPTFDTTVGNTTSDGTVVWTAREAWTRNAAVDTVVDEFTLDLAGLSEPRASDNWFNGGALTFETGPNQGLSIEIRAWDSSAQRITLFFAAPFLPASGDKVRLFPGCDKRTSTCSSKFAIPGSRDFPSSRGNIWNFRGEPHVPGPDDLTRYPDAK